MKTLSTKIMKEIEGGYFKYKEIHHAAGVDCLAKFAPNADWKAVSCRKMHEAIKTMQFAQIEAGMVW